MKKGSSCSHHRNEKMARPLHAVIIIKRQWSCAQVQILTCSLVDAVQSMQSGQWNLVDGIQFIQSPR